jgi:hypothetical protein
MNKKLLLLLILFVAIVYFTGQSTAQPKFRVVNHTSSPAGAVKNEGVFIPGKLSETVQLTPEQRKRLSGPGEFFIYGPASPISREQILNLRETRLQQMSLLESIEPNSIIGTKQKTVNDRVFWKENLFTTFTTQSETSSAIYGQHVVAGWNDLESTWFSNSTSNWAVSHNGGNTFTAKVGLPLDATTPGIVATGGDPAVAVDPVTGTFYYATLSVWNDGVTDFSGISVYQSADFGDTFNPLFTLNTGDVNDFFDKEYIAVDPSNGKVYVTFTWFNDVSPFSNIVTWNVGDDIIQTIASNDTGLQGSIPEVGSDHALYVAYESWDVSGAPSIKIRKSGDFGANFDPEVNVYGPFVGSADLDASSFCGRDAIKGNIRSQEFPSLAVDTRSSGTGAGNAYIAFNARDSITNFLDIYLTRSTDGGTTWSTPIRANPRAAGDESDKFFPWVAVNGKGKVGLIYYERKKTPGVTGLSNNNWWISANVRRFSPALVFIDAAKVSPEFPVIVNNDFTSACYMAEYNSISANRKGVGDDNFFAFWGDNRFGDPDIQFSKVVPQ